MGDPEDLAVNYASTREVDGQLPANAASNIWRLPRAANSKSRAQEKKPAAGAGYLCARNVQAARLRR